METTSSKIQPLLPPWMMPCMSVHTPPIRMCFRAQLEGHSGMWQEGSSAEGLIWIARGAELQSFYLPQSTDAAQVAQSFYYCTGGEA